MSTTTQVTITKSWQKLHTESCIVQSFHNVERFRFAGGETMPVGDIGMLYAIHDGPAIDLRGAVWCRLPDDSATDSVVVTVIK